MSVAFAVHDFVLWLLELVYLDKSQFLLTQKFVDQLFNYYIYHSNEKLEESLMIFSQAQLKIIDLISDGETSKKTKSQIYAEKIRYLSLLTERI